jgi:hypothetical protein
MRLSEYLIEAVAVRTTGKYLEPSKEPVIEWLDSHGFRRYEYYEPDTDIHLREKDKTYMVGPNIKGRETSDWVSIHTPETYEIVMWFDQRTGRISDIELRGYSSNGDSISFLKAKSILDKSL